MWETRKLENILKVELKKQLGDSEGDKYFGYYTTARHKLIENLLEEIKAKIPDMSDHGSRHIANVIDNTERLLGRNVSEYTGLELYCLVVSILFHDVGNIYGREKHNKRITEIYNIVRGEDVSFLRERNIITKIAEAHCGKNKEGGIDTLVDVKESDHIAGYKIRTRELASVLRFADELAEGQQRTSLFWNHIDPNHYPIESKIYHKYASICNVHIDEGNSRISLSYDVELKDLSEPDFKDLISFIYKRIVKLDEERKYCKYYCNALNSFKAVKAEFNFSNDGHHIDIGLESLVLNDMQKPGEFKKKIEEISASHNIESIWSKLNKSQA